MKRIYLLGNQEKKLVLRARVPHYDICVCYAFGCSEKRHLTGLRIISHEPRRVRLGVIIMWMALGVFI